MTARISLILNGRHDDRGFVQEGYEGVLKARDWFGFDLEIIEHHRKDPAVLEALDEGAVALRAGGIIVHGSRSDGAIAPVAARRPGCRFLSAGGRAEGANVWNYAIRHYRAAHPGGVLAWRMTRTGTVADLSGVFISPWRKGRAADVAGVRDTAPEVAVLTVFCGDQDDPYLSDRSVEAQAAAGADIVFTMLDYGRSGVIVGACARSATSATCPQRTSRCFSARRCPASAGRSGHGPRTRCPIGWCPVTIATPVPTCRRLSG